MTQQKNKLANFLLMTFVLGVLIPGVLTFILIFLAPETAHLFTAWPLCILTWGISYQVIAIFLGTGFEIWGSMRKKKREKENPGERLADYAMRKRMQHSWIAIIIGAFVFMIGIYFFAASMRDVYMFGLGGIFYGACLYVAMKQDPEMTDDSEE